MQKTLSALALDQRHLIELNFQLLKNELKPTFVSNYLQMQASVSAQDQLAALMAKAMPREIIDFKFDDTVQVRISELTNLKKTGQITEEQTEELDTYLTYDLLIGLAKVRARKQLR